MSLKVGQLQVDRAAVEVFDGVCADTALALRGGGVVNLASVARVQQVERVLRVGEVGELLDLVTEMVGPLMVDRGDLGRKAKPKDVGGGAYDVKLGVSVLWALAQPLIEMREPGQSLRVDELKRAMRSWVDVGDPGYAAGGEDAIAIARFLDKQEARCPDALRLAALGPVVPVIEMLCLVSEMASYQQRRAEVERGR